MIEQRGILEVLVEEMARALLPLTEVLDDPVALRYFLAELGWQMPESVTSIGLDPNKVGDVLSAFTAVAELDLENAQATTIVSTYATLISALAALAEHIYDARTTIINHLDAAFIAASDIVQELPKRLLDCLIVEYLSDVYEPLFYVLLTLGILELRDFPKDDATFTSEHTRRIIHFDRILKLLTDSRGLLQDVYGWGTSTADLGLLIERLYKLFLCLGLPASLEFPDLEKQTNLWAPVPVPSEGESENPELRIPLFSAGELDVESEIGLTLYVVPPLAAGGAPGFAIGPYIAGATGSTVPLDYNERWLLTLSSNLDLALGIGIVIRPGQELKVLTDILGAGTTVQGSIDLQIRRQAAADETILLLAAADLLALRAHALYLKCGLALSTREKAELFVEFGADDALLALTSGKADSFLQKILPAEALNLNFDLGIGWSLLRGVYLRGSSSLEVVIGAHKTFGPLLLESVHAEIKPANEALALTLAVSGATTLGPLSVAVDTVGVQMHVTFSPAGSDYGPVNIQTVFRPPNGLGLLIDAGAIKGGGYLSFDYDNGRYAGVLQLSITQANLALTAIGLLDTRLPGGVKGFSFLLIITAQFPRIQLGFGFALTGVGGLAGINRSIVVEALQTGVRNHSVDHILFPKNPVAEATQLISDLRTIFPPTEGQYVFGPMASIVWGTPTIIEAELGIILELPNPIRLIILGQLNAVLPDQKSAIVELHLDIVGVLEFAEKRLAIDATLHDSRLAAFNAYGDMALRLSWGDPPNFALAVGGLHPQFQAPPGFPTLRRMTVALGTGENPRLSLQTYLAVTSNTVQIGALAELYAEAGGFNIYGWIGFDVLIVSPFSFTANLSAGVALRRGTQVIASVHVSATLTGPDFWHSWGEASISLLFFSVTVHFDATFGVPVPTEVEVTTPWDALQAEIGKTANWSITPPPASSQVVTLTAPPIGEASPTLLDPLGGLTLREKAVPLDRTLTRFGEGHLDQPQRFTIHGVTVGSLPATPGSPLLDHFAPAQFEEMGDAEKLSRPSFERMQAGTTIASDAVLFNAQTSRVDTFTYETVVIDAPDQPSRQVKPYTLSADHQSAALASSAAAQSLLRTTGLEKFAPSPTTPPLATLAEEEYVIADVVSLNEQTDVPVPKPRTKGAAFQALAQYLEQHPRKRGQLEVAPAHEVIKEGV